MEGNMYLMDFWTNLHMGGLGDGFSIVDKQVQRDPVTELPTVHASSLKGALRAYAEEHCEADMVNAAFGEEAASGEKAPAPGSMCFLPAQLLFFPVRTNQFPYVLASSPALIGGLLDYMELAGMANSAAAAVCKLLHQQKPSKGKAAMLGLGGAQPDLRVETMTAFACDGELPLSALLPGLNRLAWLDDADMLSLCEDLPILAHNKLENGVSQTLWYEEVVPRKSVFYTLLCGSQPNHLSVLDQTLTRQDAVIQFGANASLGYGLCKMTRLHGRDGEHDA